MPSSGARLAVEFRRHKAILGVFNQGKLMGMYNAIIDDELLNPAGIYKERLADLDGLLAEDAHGR